jgi:haloalkane dehalogenase
MRNLQRTPEKARRYKAAVDTRTVPYPVQIVWGVDDPILSLRRYGMAAREAAGLPMIRALPGKHFLQEDMAPEIAGAVAELALAG